LGTARRKGDAGNEGDPSGPEGGRGFTVACGGKNGKYGTPQGGVASPLLANIYMNRFLKHWRLTGRGEASAAHIVNYADDSVPRTH